MDYGPVLIYASPGSVWECRLLHVLTNKLFSSLPTWFLTNINEVGHCSRAFGPFECLTSLSLSAAVSSSELLGSSSPWGDLGLLNLCTSMLLLTTSAHPLRDHWPKLPTSPLPLWEASHPLPPDVWLSHPAGWKGHHSLLTHPVIGWKSGSTAERHDPW